MITTVGSYLLERLRQSLGVRHIFGVPGDFTLSFNTLIQRTSSTTGITFVNTCNGTIFSSISIPTNLVIDSLPPLNPYLFLNEMLSFDRTERRVCSGRLCSSEWLWCVRSFWSLVMVVLLTWRNYAGVLCCTYGVGELSAVNAVAGCYAERVPILVIVGTPPRRAFASQLPLHHTLGDYHTPRQMYKRITVAAKILDDPENAPAVIDRVLALSKHYQLPAYLALPCDMISMPCAAPVGDLPRISIPKRSMLRGEEDAVHEAAQEAAELLNRARTPVIIVDVECGRYKLTNIVQKIIEQSQVRFCLLGGNQRQDFSTTLISHPYLNLVIPPVSLRVYDNG